MTEAVANLPFKRTTLGDVSTGNKTRMWKSLKQILAIERTLQWPETAVTCKHDSRSLSQCSSIILFDMIPPDSSVNAPPSFLPAKKYSDISGLIAPYTDPQSKLQFHNSEEFVTLRSLPNDLTAGYLALRGASSIVG